jgi:hypothetical protein
LSALLGGLLAPAQHGSFSSRNGASGLSCAGFSDISNQRSRRRVGYRKPGAIISSNPLAIDESLGSEKRWVGQFYIH